MDIFITKYYNKCITNKIEIEIKTHYEKIGQAIKLDDSANILIKKNENIFLKMNHKIYSILLFLLIEIFFDS